MKNKALLAIFSIIVFIPGCTQMVKKPIIRCLNIKKSLTPPTHISLDCQKPQSTEPLPITIWVHGTRLLPDGVFKQFFFSKRGLNHYASINEKYHQRQIAETLIKADSMLFPAETFYLFGWNGKLSFKERELAARQLYLDLKQVREDYKKKYDSEPIIRMISHSHGGNIILLLAQVKDPEDSSFFVNDIILMGTPVQKQTKQHAHADCFGQVYSLYSMLDIFQIIDPQGLQQKETGALFSERFFPHHEKIEQVAVKVNNRSIMHIEFIRKTFIAQLPHIISEIKTWKKSSGLCYSEWVKKEKCLHINIKRS